MNTALESLFKKRLIIISGKGGVGKTTLTVTLALLAAKQGLNSLIVELGSTGRVSPLFDDIKINYKEVPLAPRISGIQITSHESFEEYVVRQIKFKALFDTFINNRFVTYFLNAVPGLNDILMIGKVYDLERQTDKNGKPVYDCIFVDAPTTGHGISTFEVPQVVSKAVKVGPLHKEAEHILEVLRDKKKTIFCPVTLAEEMPVTETLELVEALEEKLKFAMGPVFVNNVSKNPFSAQETREIKSSQWGKGLEGFGAYSLLQINRSELNEEYLKVLKKDLKGHPQFILPHLPHGVNKARDLEPLVATLEVEVD